LVFFLILPTLELLIMTISRYCYYYLKPEGLKYGKEFLMAKALDVAKYILCLSEPEQGDLISNLKLQKLMYYSQGTHLALYDKLLFEEGIEAWTHGPVVASIYHEFKHFSNAPIESPESFDLNCLTQDEKDSIEEAYEEFGQYSAWKLRNMTHDEPPWKDTPSGSIISIDSMRKYFKSLLV
jgi:uncharacterized phage-associated protein